MSVYWKSNLCDSTLSAYNEKGDKLTERLVADDLDKKHLEMAFNFMPSTLAKHIGQYQDNP